jgi:aminopeptidase N
MKNIYTFLFMMLSIGSFAQTTDREFEELVQAEKRAAGKKMRIQVNPLTDKYDVVYHRLDLAVDPADQYISGEVTTKYIAKENLSSVVFELSNDLVVSSVVQRGTSLSFTRSANNEVIINLPVVQNATVLDSVSITYAGIPTSSGFGAFSTSTHNSVPVLWTLSEPFGAMEWWPCKQDLNDKIDSIDVYITTPSNYTAVANGMQQSKIAVGNGNSKTHFKHGYPIPAYLIAIAVTNYAIYTQQAGLGTPESPFFPIVNYQYPETAATNTTSLAVTPSIMNFFENTFGPYPFRNEKYGHAQFSWGGGMEHTTVSFMTAGSNGGYSRSLIAHELGHQWFGDKVTCGTWKDIWLNEGFATYMASMVVEHLDGAAAFVTSKNSMITSITSQPSGAVYLTDAEALDVNRIFSSRLSYNKGAMVLHMLRYKLGDTAFFQGLLNYLNDPELSYAYAKTPDLQGHLEAASGENLDEFFNDWVYKQGYPIYTITAQNIAPGQARVTINQAQSHSSVSFFEMPVPVRLNGAGGQSIDLRLEHTTNGQQFIVNVPFVVTGVVFNANKDIISKNGSATLGSASFELSELVGVYPNPTSSEINISLPNTIAFENCDVFNALGQKIGTYNSTQFNIDQLAVGMYSLVINTSEGSIHKNIIKK